VNEYSGRLPVFHMDLYRIGAEADGFELGIMDYLARAGSGVMIIEWAEKILALLPEDILKVNFTVISARKRQIEFSSIGTKYDALLKGLLK
jgi:tRNA threonylcarbamoyladenosine biosynthesis protein TsaE